MLLDFGEGESIDEEELIYRTFRRALEARVMIMRNRLPIQIAHNHLLEPSEFRVLTSNGYPPRRGTLCTVNGTSHFLYTTGFYNDWGTYPGPHVQQPLEVIPDGRSTDLRRVGEEALGLTKMNWNSALIGGRDPITLHMACEVGPIMAEVPEHEQPQLSYRLYTQGKPR